MSDIGFIIQHLLGKKEKGDEDDKKDSNDSDANDDD